MGTGATIDQWNTARSIASAGYRVIAGEAEYEAVASEFEGWPFTDSDDLASTFESAIDESETKREQVDDFARAIMSRGEELQTSEPLSSWNTAQSIASQLLDAEQDGMLQSRLEDIDDGLNLPEKPTIQSEIDQSSSSPRTQQLQSLARLLYTETSSSNETATKSGSKSPSLEVSERPVEEQDEPTDDVTEVTIEEPDVSPLALEISEGIAAYYIDRDTNGISHLINEYPDVEFPHRDKMMMKAMNAKGTRQERVYELAEWVDTWVSPSEGEGGKDESYEYYYGRVVPSE